MNTKDELRQLINNARCLMDNLPGLIFIKDTEFNFVECSYDFSSLVKINKKDIIGQTDYNLPWAGYADVYRRRDEGALKGITSIELELMPINKNTLLTVKASKHPIRNSDGEIIGVLGQTDVLSSKDELGKLLSAVIPIDKKNTAHSKCTPRSYQINSYKLKLTQRETECLFLLIRGKSAKEIAQFLSLSHRTIEEYIEHIKGKMNVLSKFDLINKAIEMGLLEIIPKNEMLINLYKNHNQWRDFL